MKKIFIGCLIGLCLLLNSCIGKEKLGTISYKYNRTVENGYGHEYFEIYNDDELIFQKDDVRFLKDLDGKCFAVFYQYPKPFYGYFFDNGKLIKKLEKLSPVIYISSDLLYVIYFEYEKIETEWTYTNLVVRKIPNGKIIKKWNFSEIARNKSFNGTTDWSFSETDNLYRVVLKDGWGEI